jgi:hypothetical protein
MTRGGDQLVNVMLSTLPGVVAVLAVCVVVLAASVLFR